jgi:hypothetical protein
MTWTGVPGPSAAQAGYTTPHTAQPTAHHIINVQCVSTVQHPQSIKLTEGWGKIWKGKGL